MDFKINKISFKNKIHSVKINKTNFKIHFKKINLDSITIRAFKWDNQIIINKTTAFRENKEHLHLELISKNKQINLEIKMIYLEIILNKIIHLIQEEEDYFDFM